MRSARVAVLAASSREAPPEERVLSLCDPIGPPDPLECSRAGAKAGPGGPVAEVMAEPAALEDGKARAVNERHGDDHGVNLGKLRTFAKRLRTRHELAGGLWRTGDTAARLRRH